MRNQGEGLSLEKLKMPLDRIWKKKFLKREPKTPICAECFSDFQSAFTYVCLPSSLLLQY